VFAGPDLPQATGQGATMVPMPDGTGVVLIGDVYELKCSSTYCNWSLMEKHLSVSRWYAVAMYVPDSFAVCAN
jgi:H+/gluconate symporter-like permease